MKYQITLDHEDFVTLIDILRKAQDGNIINWSAKEFICCKTSIIC